MLPRTCCQRQFQGRPRLWAPDSSETISGKPEVVQLHRWRSGQNPSRPCVRCHASAARAAHQSLTPLQRRAGPGWRVDGAYTFLDARDRTGDRVTDGKQLIGRAAHTVFGEAAVPFGAWTAAAGVRAVSAVPVTAGNTKWLDGYALWHARLRWQATAALRLDLEGRNLLDNAYEDLRGYATAGREILFGVRFTPGGS